MSTGFRFNAMHFMPYVYLPENHKEYKTTWVDFPNKFYDPVKGHELYQSYFEQLVLADRLGFDAIVLNEHQHRVRHDGHAKRRGSRSDSASPKGEDLRLGGAAELHAAKPARGGIRYSGRHVERPLGNCISLGNGNGILVQPGKSRNGTGEVPGIPEDY